MTTYTTRPHPWWPETHVEILADGVAVGGTPKDREQEMIAHIETTRARHWGEVLDRQQTLDPHLVIADGHGYTIGNEDDYPKGFGGRRWQVTFYDGREIITTSLWHMGDIPADWRERLPDNAILRNLW